MTSDDKPRSHPLELDPIAQAVSAARRFVRGELARLGRADLEDSAELGVSELVTNATVHARTRLAVTVALVEGVVRVSVRDFSQVIPLQRRYGLEATTGRGLRLVEALSSAWGAETVTDEAGTGKVVWFEPVAEMSADAFGDPDAWLRELGES